MVPPTIIFVFLVASSPATTRLNRALGVQRERDALLGGRLLLLVNRSQMVLLLGPGLHRVSRISCYRGALAGMNMVLLVLIRGGYRSAVLRLELVTSTVSCCCCAMISLGCLRLKAIRIYAEVCVVILRTYCVLVLRGGGATLSESAASLSILVASWLLWTDKVIMVLICAINSVLIKVKLAEVNINRALVWHDLRYLQHLHLVGRIVLRT